VVGCKINFCILNFFFRFVRNQQFAIRKSTISKYRATSIFDFHMRFSIFKASGLLTNLKKKIKHAEIDFTSHHSFLRVRRDQFLPNCKKPTLIYTANFFSMEPHYLSMQSHCKSSIKFSIRLCQLKD
jgi:hypothetical protein